MVAEFTPFQPSASLLHYRDHNVYKDALVEIGRTFLAFVAYLLAYFSGVCCAEKVRTGLALRWTETIGYALDLQLHCVNQASESDHQNCAGSSGLASRLSASAYQ